MIALLHPVSSMQIEHPPQNMSLEWELTEGVTVRNRKKKRLLIRPPQISPVFPIFVVD
jgi:hypothetical protein